MSPYRTAAKRVELVSIEVEWQVQIDNGNGGIDVHIFNDEIDALSFMKHHMPTEQYEGGMWNKRTPTIIKVVRHKRHR